MCFCFGCCACLISTVFYYMRQIISMKVCKNPGLVRRGGLRLSSRISGQWFSSALPSIMHAWRPHHAYSPRSLLMISYTIRIMLQETFIQHSFAPHDPFPSFQSPSSLSGTSNCGHGVLSGSRSILHFLELQTEVRYAIHLGEFSCIDRSQNSAALSGSIGSKD